MGMFSTLGGIVGTVFGGPTGGAIGTGVGGFLDDNGSSMASGYMNYQAQQDTNETNVRLAHETQDFNAAEAAKTRAFQAEQIAGQQSFNSAEALANRDFQDAQAAKQMGFQERMANTSYQRAVGDMKAAGLNPMLAYSQGGASSPSGASGAGSAASAGAASGATASGVPVRVQSAVSAATASAAQAAQIRNAIDTNSNIRAQADKTRAEADLVRAQIPKVQQDTQTSAASAGQMNAQAKYLGELYNRTYVEVVRAGHEASKLKSDAERSAYENQYLLPLRKRLLELDIQLQALEVPGAQNSAAAQAKHSDYFQNVSPFVNDVARGAGAAGSLGLKLPNRSISSGSVTSRRVR